VPEGYIGFVEELPGASIQATTLDEARASLAEAVELVLEANPHTGRGGDRRKEVIREKMPLPAA
jgi:predicted RNase H-like HicB family nuclease